MGWTNPKTWLNEPLLKDDLNTEVRDNLKFLHHDPQEYHPNTSNYTTTSTILVSIDSTPGTFKQTISSIGGKLLVYGTLSLSSNVTTGVFDFDIEVDGVSVTPGTYAFRFVLGTATIVQSKSFVYPIEGLSDGSHDVELKWAVVSGTGTLYAGTGYQSRFGVMKSG